MSSVEERFNKYVLRTDSCWVWTAAVERGGYGKFQKDGKARRAHRVAYELWCGPLDDQLVVHHKCGNRICVRPDHLQAVSAQHNAAEMLERRGYEQAIERLTNEVIKLRKELDKERRRNEKRTVRR